MTTPQKPPSPRLVFAESTCDLALAPAESALICLFGWVCRQQSGLLREFVRPCPTCNTRDVARQALRWDWQKQRGNVALDVPDPDKRFDNFLCDTHAREVIVEQCREYVTAFETNTAGAGLILLGATGRGKTHLANAIWLSLLEYYPAVCALWITASDFYALCTDEYSDNAERREAARDWLDRLRQIAVLFLDDLGREGYVGRAQTSEAFLRAAHHLFDRRYHAKTPTILTANMSASAIVDRYGEPLARRMIAGAKVIAFDEVPLYTPPSPPRDGRAAAAGETLEEDRDALPF